jgi:2-phosphosulfolactate phosphatase
MLYLINAADGCAWARQHRAVAIVVDTLRASSTVAILLERAREVIVVRTVEDAQALAARCPGALLVGERRGLPPAGFDLGNSPVAARSCDCTGRSVIFTSTTGAARATAVMEEEVPSLFLGAPVNAQAVAQAAWATARRQACDIVLIPAGHVEDDQGTGPEDAAGATVIGLALQSLGVPLAPGTVWAFDPTPPEQIPQRAAAAIRTSPHARFLATLGPEFQADVDFCCRLNVTPSVPRCVGTVPLASGERGMVFTAA